MVTRLVTGCVRARPRVRATCVRCLDAAWGVAICRIILSLRGCVALECGLVSLGLRCFLRLAHALYCRSRRCLASVALSVYHTLQHVVHCLAELRYCIDSRMVEQPAVAISVVCMHGRVV